VLGPPGSRRPPEGVSSCRDPRFVFSVEVTNPAAPAVDDERREGMKLINRKMTALGGLVVMLGSLGLAAAPTASADSFPPVPSPFSTSPVVQPRQGGVGCGPVSTTISNVRAGGTSIQSPAGPNWSVAAVGPGQLTLAKSVSVQNSSSGSVGISASTISANVGFNVSQAFTTEASYQVSVPAGQTWILRADAVYSLKTFNWKQSQTCNFPGGSYSRSGSGSALRFERLQYRAYRQ
jgi:hypothetical protein